MSEAVAEAPTSEAVVAYIPVLHEGYRRFLDAHAGGRPLYLIGPELYADYRPLAKDIRCLDAHLLASAIAAWGTCARVEVLDEPGARALALRAPLITLPAEDVSYRLVERFFAGCEVRYDTVFLRWDKSRTAQLLRPGARAVSAAGSQPAGDPPALGDARLAELIAAAQERAAASVDWWRQVGAAIRLGDGTVLTACNEHEPHRLSAYAVGDPRANFRKGVALELSTATHAEARLIARAAREGRATAGAVLYVTDFPCPPCAKLLAHAGIERLYFRDGYALLDGQDVLEAAGVELVQVG
ncbi:MAG TPA: deaminase [Solirubrobacteraceae bacterium]|nr:deaminase [Solirubrobacteraceae bacterium]